MTTAPWWADAVVYQVYVRSFRDANGDGQGDLAGITDGLDSLVDLGVDAVWLTPFYPSPLHDSGYDISDHRGVDPRYGDISDFDELVDKAHALGLRVLVDLVPNHVSIDHFWFQAALAEGPSSPHRALFHFANGRGDTGDEPPTNWCSVFTGSAWSRVTEPDGSPGQWYLHLFDTTQPDLNWDAPEVRADVLATMNFWLDHGVDGFRVDVAMGMAKDLSAGDHPDPVGLTDAMRLDLFDGSPQSYARRDLMAESPIFDVDGVHEILREWRRVLDERDPELLTVGEAWTHPPERARRYARPDELRQTFNFDFLVTPWSASAIAAQIQRTLDEDAAGSPATWALSNHDTPRVATRLGGGAVGLSRARALMLLTLALPGTVYTYQGDELGLEDVDLPASARQDPVFTRSHGEQLGRDGGRVPIPWSDEPPAYGFGPTAPTWLPQPHNWAALSRAAQHDDPASTLSLVRAACHVRRERRDAWRQAAAEVSLHEGRDGQLVLVHRAGGFVCATNCSSETIELPTPGRLVLDSSTPSRTNRTVDSVPPESTVWFEMGVSWREPR